MWVRVPSSSLIFHLGPGRNGAERHSTPDVLGDVCACFIFVTVFFFFILIWLFVILWSFVCFGFMCHFFLLHMWDAEREPECIKGMLCVCLRQACALLLFSMCMWCGLSRSELSYTFTTIFNWLKKQPIWPRALCSFQAGNLWFLWGFFVRKLCGAIVPEAPKS